MTGQNSGGSVWLWHKGNKIPAVFTLATLIAAPSCQNAQFPNPASLVVALDQNLNVQEGEATLSDGDDAQVNYKNAFQTSPRVAIVELRQSKFDKKPFSRSDFQIVQVEASYFKIQNVHSEQRLGSWATIKWRAEGVPADKNQLESTTKPGQSAQIVKPTQGEIVNRVKKLGGTVTLYPLFSGTIVGVDLHRTRATDADVELLQGLTQLRTLNLYGTHITDASLGFLSAMADLHTLYLNETAVTDAGMARLQGLVHLSELGLHDTHVTDEGLFYLRSLVNLQSITLSGPRITDHGLLQLKVFHDLKRLVLSHTNVTAAGIQVLKETLPKVQVIR